MPILCRSIFFLHNLRLLYTLISSSLFNVDFEINCTLVLIAIFTFDDLCSIFNAQYASVILAILTVLMIILIVKSLLSIEISLCFWFTTDVALLLSNWISSSLSSRNNRTHSFSCCFDNLLSSFISLFR